MNQPTDRDEHSSSLMSPSPSWSPLLEHLPWLTEDDRNRVLTLATQISIGLEEFVRRYPDMRRVRIKPLAISVAAAAPFCRASALVSTAKVSLWIFALDDQFDEEVVTEDEIMRRSANYLRLLNQQPVPPSRDALQQALVELREDLQSYALYRELGQGWSAAMCRTIDGMLTELRWRQAYRRRGIKMLPDYDQYMTVGRYSIGGPPHFWSTLVTIEDPSTPDHLEHLLEMERLASMAIRLANDLRSHVKEMAEGKFNALDILSQVHQRSGLPAPLALKAAQNEIIADIGCRLQQLSILHASARTVTGRPESAISNTAKFVCRFYDQYDFHTFDTSQ